MKRLESRTAISRSPDALSRVVTGELLIVDLRSGHYFGLDSIGTRVWELIADTVAFGDVLSALLAEYQVEPDRARADLERLLGELVERGLVRIGEEPQ